MPGGACRPPARFERQPLKPVPDRRSAIAYLQAAPMALVFGLFFIVPLVLVVVVSFFDYNEYEIIPAVTGQNYKEIFEGCAEDLPALCVTLIHNA